MLQNDVGTCGWLAEELSAAHVVERERLEPHLAEFTAECPYADADAFAKHLAREGILSKYQARRALDGDAKKLVLGAYLLVDVMGAGSLGPVYKALGRSDRKPYAVKVLPRRAWNLQLARSQVRAFGGLPSQDGIVPFIDVGSAHGLHYFVWPFAEGRTLESLIREHGPLAPGEIARIGVRIAEALRIGLTRGLVHGLIKPSNILIAPDGLAKLLDFRIAALLPQNPEEDALVDTVSRAESMAHMLECAAPESIADSTKCTPAADQYSLGCTMYFAAAGRYPFPGGGFVDKIFKHQMNKPAPVRSLNPDIPPGLADIIARLMHKMPSDRYAKLSELIGELAPLATVSRIQPPTPVDVYTPAPPRRLVVASPLAQSALEPPQLDLNESLAKRGVLGRMFGNDKSAEPLHVAIVAGGPAQPGQTIVLHVYVHAPADELALAEAARKQSGAARVLGRTTTPQAVAYGSHVGLHLAVAGATIAEPLRELDRARQATTQRFAVTIAGNAPKQALTGRLTVGQEGLLIGQVDFVIPMAK